MSHLAWRRCATCQQLTIVPTNARACWQCGAPMGSRAEGSHEVGQAPIGREVAGLEAIPSVAGVARFGDLTAEEDAVARRLLRSVFPDGVDLDLTATA